MKKSVSSGRVASHPDLRFDRTEETLMAEDSRSESAPHYGLDLTRLIPDLLARYFEFFRPGHNEGAVPARIKELARLKIAALNQCDT